MLLYKIVKIGNFFLILVEMPINDLQGLQLIQTRAQDLAQGRGRLEFLIPGPPQAYYPRTHSPRKMK